MQKFLYLVMVTIDDLGEDIKLVSEPVFLDESIHQFMNPM
jgi:hypothetical protein